MDATDADDRTTGTATGKRVGPVVVGIDGSANAMHALDVAADLALAFRDEDRPVDLVVVHALGLLAVIDGAHVPLAGREAEVAERLERDWCAPLRERRELRWQVRFEFGTPADVVLRVAADEDAAFVVVGSRGIEDRAERLLGSTSHRVVHHADMPVVVVPPHG